MGRPWSAIALALAGCAGVSGPQELALDSIDPPSGLTTKDTAVQLHGSGFTFSLSSDLDRGTTTSLDTVSVTIGPNALADATWRGTDLLEGTVPAGLTPGTYDVTVTMGTRMAMLSGGFEVLADTVLPLGPFGAPALIGPLSSPGSLDDDPSLTADMLELYFNSDRPGGVGLNDIWVSTRSQVTDPWGMPVVVPNVSLAGNETTPKVSPDGLTLYFASNRAGSLGAYDIWVSTRPSRTSAWPNATQVVELSSTQDDTGASVDSSGLRLVLSSTRTGNSEVFMATRATPQDPWDTPIALAEVNSGDGDADPYLANQGRTLVFISNRPGGMGFDDIYIAQRASGTGLFDSPALVPEINSADIEEDPWISDDLRHIVFTSNGEIYEAFR